MALVSTGIDEVTACELPGGVWDDGSCLAAPRVALVKWRSCHSDMLHQVYVNGQFAGATVDTHQRQIVIQIPSSFESAVRIEVFAVAVEQAHMDFSSEVVPSRANSGRVKITLLRGQSLPLGAAVNVFFDAGGGQIDYDEPLNPSPIQIWSSWMDKAGFGMSVFGASDFGWDSAAAVGFGKGSFGNGQFGLDADTIEWLSEPLPMGVYKFSVKIIDAAGNESSASETGPLTVTPAARPAEGLSVLSFNAQTNELAFEIR